MGKVQVITKEQKIILAEIKKSPSLAELFYFTGLLFVSAQVNLYFLLKKFSLLDLISGVRVKFNMEIEPFLLASDFTRVDIFRTLPRMIRPLTILQLKEFFHLQARKLGKKKIKV